MLFVSYFFLSSSSSSSSSQHKFNTYLLSLNHSCFICKLYFFQEMTNISLAAYRQIPWLPKIVLYMYACIYVLNFVNNKTKYLDVPAQILFMFT